MDYSTNVYDPIIDRAIRTMAEDPKIRSENCTLYKPATVRATVMARTIRPSNVHSVFIESRDKTS